VTISYKKKGWNPVRIAAMKEGGNMFGKKSNSGYTETLSGVKIKTLVYGENTLMTEFVLSMGAILPEHQHVHEQIGYLVKGQIKLFIESESQIIYPGDSWCVPSNSKHRAEIIEDSIAIEIFSPCREEYKQYIVENDIR
jgi:quercetin dioxygenase-like cupin family protein